MADPNAPKTDLVTTSDIPNAMALPSFIERDNFDGKDIDSKDIILPRLAIAQSNSKAMTPTDPEYLENLKLYDLYNTMTQEIYGKMPIKFLPIKRRVVYIEFDADDPNIPVDLDVPEGDPRTKWTKNPDGSKGGVPPRATRYSEFVILIVGRDKEPEPIVLSIKESNKHAKKAADRLTMLISTTPGPSYACYREVAVKPVQNESGTWGTFITRNAGMMQDTDAEKQLYNFAKRFKGSMENKIINVSREVGADDLAGSDTFNPEELERGASDLAAESM